MTSHYTVPGLSPDAAATTVELLDERMVSLIDLTLTLKHVHWNVVGPQFIGVHEMLDPQHEAAQKMVDSLAERIATLGGVPVGTAGALVARRGWDDYSLTRASVPEHLAALDVAYRGIIEAHRKAQQQLAELDPVSEGIILDQLQQLEMFQWFVRAHLENSAGELASSADTETGAAQQARAAFG